MTPMNFIAVDFGDLVRVIQHSLANIDVNLGCGQLLCDRLFF